MTSRLDHLTAGQVIPFGGDRCTTVSDDLAAAFQPGDRLVVVQETGDLLHIPQAEHQLVAAAVEAAHTAFFALAACTDEQISDFYEFAADRLGDDQVFAHIAAANDADVAAAKARGRSTTRLMVDTKMRSDMISGLWSWRDSTIRRQVKVHEVHHDTWSVSLQRSPLGVVGFVFEGRPNVFADATGVLRTGNTAVFRIGSDALGTATAIMQHVVRPSLHDAALPAGSVQLVASAAHAAGWALFSDQRLGLAVARGSGGAVAQLGAVARQHGVPASLHGTGGAWLVLGDSADADVVGRVVQHSLDRKVCNTMNVCCVVQSRAADLIPVVRAAAQRAADRRGAVAVIHEVPFAEANRLGHEFEWENDPEFWLVVVPEVSDAVSLFNTQSPRFVASLISEVAGEHESFFASIDAPFVGNGFTRWVDGQFALGLPELGLSNWQGGRLFARGGVLSGDSVYTVRAVAEVRDHDTCR
jgi:glutamate-5-semialdehyde dehydrogenase